MAAGVEMFAQFHATTRMLLEMQASQNRLLERYLDSQERLLYNCGQGVSFSDVGYANPALAEPVAVAAPVPQVAAAVPAPVPRQPVSMPAPAAVPTPKVVTVPTAPSIAVPTPVAVTVPSPVVAPVAPATVSAAPVVTPVAAAQPVAPVAAPVAQGQAAPAGNAPPPVDTFRRDLLQIVSERTGYPTDMLDEELPLEAGLGIDSIKTVEIFSNLKDYHAFFRDENQDEEEALTEFTNLKTLSDIIKSYERRREAILAAGGSANGATHVGTNGTGSGVERFSVTAIEAPLEGNGSKKNFLSATSS